MMNSREERIACMALNLVPGIGSAGAKRLVDSMGSAQAVFEKRLELPHLLQDVGERLSKVLDCPEAWERAKREEEFIEKNNLTCLTISDEAYPSRLRDCEDAPIVLFFKGNTNLNALRIVSMVGTRHATEYGRELCDTFVRDLQSMCPDVLVVSGLAYGIDINAHRAALLHGLPTVGVLAHGLDRIYPAANRNTAVQMLQNGGLLTEFMSETNPDRHNFVRRNRIVAGMADATIVVESASKGGSLITADIAESYHRDCFAFPGRVGDELSLGCNQLIRDNKASLLLSAEDFVKSMGWDEGAHGVKPKAVQRNLFPDLSEDEQRIVDILQRQGNQQINTLVVEADIPIHKMNALLFEMEMKGVVKALAGGIYKLLS